MPTQMAIGLLIATTYSFWYSHLRSLGRKSSSQQLVVVHTIQLHYITLHTLVRQFSRALSIGNDAMLLRKDGVLAYIRCCTGYNKQKTYKSRFKFGTYRVS
jgi:hypothetical protein